MKLFTRSLVCRQAVALISDYLDGLLPSGDRRRLERHLAACPACSAYLDQVRTTKSLLGVVTVEDVSSDALERLTQLYLDFRADEE